MENVIIIGIIAILLIAGVREAIKHFKGEGGCCGGSSGKKKRKKIKNVIAKKTFKVEGMTCEHCKNRVERAIDDIEGAAARVSLAKKEVLVLLNREISDEELIAAIEKAGYEVVK